MQRFSDAQVIDDTGAALFLLEPAKRIVSLTATGLDIVFELGLHPVGYLAKGIADQPEFYGDRAQQIAPVGSWMFPQIHRIKALQPDLILGWAVPASVLQTLVEQHCTCVFDEQKWLCSYAATIARYRTFMRSH